MAELQTGDSEGHHPVSVTSGSASPSEVMEAESSAVQATVEKTDVSTEETKPSAAGNAGHPAGTVDERMDDSTMEAEETEPPAESDEEDA